LSDKLKNRRGEKPEHERGAFKTGERPHQLKCELGEKTETSKKRGKMRVALQQGGRGQNRTVVGREIKSRETVHRQKRGRGRGGEVTGGDRRGERNCRAVQFRQTEKERWLRLAIMTTLGSIENGGSRHKIEKRGFRPRRKVKARGGQRGTDERLFRNTKKRGGGPRNLKTLEGE